MLCGIGIAFCTFVLVPAPVLLYHYLVSKTAPEPWSILRDMVAVWRSLLPFCWNILMGRWKT